MSFFFLFLFNIALGVYQRCLNSGIKEWCGSHTQLNSFLGLHGVSDVLGTQCCFTYYLKYKPNHPTNCDGSTSRPDYFMLETQNCGIEIDGLINYESSYYTYK